MVAGRLAFAPRLLVALVLTPLLWFALVWMTWIPASRTLRVRVSVPRPTTLTVFRNLGRGFYPGDAERRAVVAGTTTHELALPTEARALRLELPDASGSIEELSLAGTALPQPPAGAARTDKVTVGTLPAFDQPPLWLALSCALAALGLACATVSPRGSTFIVDACRRLARPETQTSLRGTVVTWVLFASVLLMLGRSVDAYDVLYGPIDNPPYWPISIFDPRTAPSRAALACAALAFIAAQLAMHRVAPAQQGAVPLAMGLCVCALIAGNSLGGWQAGFVEPTAGSMMYLDDARAISSVRDFLATFVAHQPQLRVHGRTHPPGAELLYYVLLHCLGSAGAISLFIGVSSMLFVSACVYGILRSRCGRDAAVFGAVCFACVPAVQVYFIATLDAVICASVAGALYCFLHRAPAVRVLGSALFLTLTMSLTFAALFLGCVLLCFDVLSRRTVRAALGCLGAAALSYAALYAATGFNWLGSLLVATRLENRKGFALLSRTGSYLFTRIECVAELALFAGPTLLVLWVGGLAGGAVDAERRELNLLSRIGLATLGSMLMTGAFKTGETARACAFLYPFIVLPVAARTRGAGALSPEVQRRLAMALLAQAFVMQVVGDYSW